MTFEELAKPEYAIDISELRALLGDQSNWKAQFTALDSLRVLNKWQHNNEFITSTLPLVLADLILLADSIRSNLSKNALLLIHEIITHTTLGSIPTDILAKIV